MCCEGLTKDSLILWKSIGPKVVEQAKLVAVHNKRIHSLLENICIDNLEGMHINTFIATSILLMHYFM